MSQVAVRDTHLFVSDSNTSGPPIVFSHGLLWSHRMYSSVIQELRGAYRCIAYDHRGQGQSVTEPRRSVAIETVTEDAIALIESLNIGPVHFVGLSMGGFVGMRIAARRPDLIQKLVLISTTSEAEPDENHRKYRLLNTITRLFGVRIVASSVLPIMFGSSFLNDQNRAHEKAQWRKELIGNRRAVTQAVQGVIERDAVTHELSQIVCPTLILHGTEDRAISLSRAKEMVQHIPNVTWVQTEFGGHSLPIECPDFVLEHLTAFLETDP